MMTTTKPIEILMTVPFGETLLADLRSVSPRVRITVINAQKVSDVPDDVWARTEILYTGRVIPSPEQVPNLKWVQFHFAGIDQVLELPLLKNSEVMFTTLSGALAPQIAEHALTMMLALGHQIPRLNRLQAKAEWPADRWETFFPLELRGATVGLVGYGSISREIARILQTFKASVLACKHDVMKLKDDGYIPDETGDQEGVLFTRLYPYQAVKSMLKGCDFIVITVPKTAETIDLINTEEIAVIQPHAYLIDVSRGGIVNQDALVLALQDKKIGGAALDVFKEEPLPQSSPLWKLPNVILSPHIAGASKYYNDRASDLFKENLRRYCAGSQLFNQFDPNQGY
ncbi:MAG: D-2-hydroxyacid dehydrogenase [Anaerolineaceae bacterium]